MKKITSRAVSLLLIAVLVVCGMTVYVLRYIDHGRDWALYFSRANSGSTGQLLDRNGVILASFSATENNFSDDTLTRIANYHVTGDYWGRTGTGVLSKYWNDLQGFSLLTGTTRSKDSTIELTIDSKLNNLAYQALGEGTKGAVLICNYRTGELLCMVSTPSVDPADADYPVEDGAYINRCLSAAFVPGSVFKLVTAAAAIETIPDIFDRSFYCEGVYDIAGVEIKCTGDHYTQTFEKALSNSCNCAFAQIAVKVGQDEMIEHVRDYGFLTSQNLDSFSSAVGSYPLDFVGDPELAWSGIGQSTDLICPYVLLRFVSAIANGGVLCEPTMMKSTEPPVKSLLVNADTADKLRRMMSYNVVDHYGGNEAFPNLDLCAKTGTAELGDGTSHAWFAGFLNNEAHPYAFVTFVEKGGSGLSVAGKITNEIFQGALYD